MTLFTRKESGPGKAPFRACGVQEPASSLLAPSIRHSRLARYGKHDVSVWIPCYSLRYNKCSGSGFCRVGFPRIYRLWAASNC